MNVDPWFVGPRIYNQKRMLQSRVTDPSSKDVGRPAMTQVAVPEIREQDKHAIVHGANLSIKPTRTTHVSPIATNDNIVSKLSESMLGCVEHA